MSWEQLAPQTVQRLSNDLNISPQVATGIVGQLGYESAGLQSINEMKPTVPGSRGGYGWAQWTGPRRRQFESWAQQNKMDVADPEANYQFLVYELTQTPEKGVLNKLQGVQDPVQAGKIFTDSYLRPGVPAYDKRASWVEKTINALVPAAQAQTQQGGNVEKSTQSPSLSTIQSALQKAQAANDTTAVTKIQQMLDTKVQQAYQKAMDAGDTTAAEKIKGMLSQTQGQAPVGQPTEEKPSLLQTAGRGIDDFVRGLADAATFGYADELAAKAESLTGGGSYQEELVKQRQRDEQGGIPRLVGQVGGSILPTVGVIQAAKGASRLGRAGAGAATGAIQGGLYGSGAAEGGVDSRLEGAVKGAAIGAPLGGAISAVLPLTKNQQFNRFVNRSGSEDTAKLDAEIIKRGQEILNDPIRSVGGKTKGLTAKDANSMVRDSFKREAIGALDRLPKDFPNRANLIKKVNEGTNLTPVEKQLLSQDQTASLILPSIEAMQRVNVLTGAEAAAGGLRETARNVSGYVLPEKLSRGVSALFGKRQTRENVISDLIKKQGKAANIVRERLGAPNTTASIQELTDLATQASKNQVAKKVVSPEEAARRTAERAAKKAADLEAKSQAELQQGIADIQSKDPTYLLGASNQFGAPRNANEMGEFSNQIKRQMEAREALNAVAPVDPAQAALQKSLADVKAKDPTYLLELSDKIGTPRNEKEMKTFSKLLKRDLQKRYGKEGVAELEPIEVVAVVKKNSLDNWSQGKTGSGGVQGTMTEYTGLKDKDLVSVLDELSQRKPDFAPFIQNIRESSKVPSTQVLGMIQDEAVRIATEQGLKVSPKILKKAAKEAGVKGTGGIADEFYKRASKVVSGLDDATLTSIINRTESASGKEIKARRAYTTGAIAKILNDKAQGRELDDVATQILEKLGL
jgi:hypothetical protein